jgi:phosphoribosylformylglycinamidine synthase
MVTIAVTRFPGTNNEHETMRALESFEGVDAKIIDHYDYDKLDNVDGVYLAGGFSYGDVLRAGAIASNTPMIEKIKELQRRQVPLLGICNGFQILTEAGLLDGALLPNLTTRFICKFIHVTVPENTSFLSEMEGQSLRLPIAHFEGNYWSNKDGEYNPIANYTDHRGSIDGSLNPNGSINNIAGVHNGKNIVGMMPHPERAVFSHQGSTDGRKIITSFLEAARC